MVKKLLASTPNMANKVLSFWRLVWDDFVESQLCTDNSFIGVKRHREAKGTRLYTPNEWRAIYAKANPRLKVVMDLLYLTDQRIGDVLKIDERELWDEGI